MPKKCLALPNMAPQEVDRFWSKVDIRSRRECWPWKGATDGHYGLVRIRNRNYKAHRIAYYLHRGVSLGDLNACHSCDNPACCNPDHIWAGSYSDNNQDRENKGRGNQPKGEYHGQATLSEQDVHHIRQSPLPAKELAAQYGVHFATIYRIRNRQSWKHI